MRYSIVIALRFTFENDEFSIVSESHHFGIELDFVFKEIQLSLRSFRHDGVDDKDRLDSRSSRKE